MYGHSISFGVRGMHTCNHRSNYECHWLNWVRSPMLLIRQQGIIKIILFTSRYKAIKHTIDNLDCTTIGHDFILNNLLLELGAPLYCMFILAEMTQPGSNCASLGTALISSDCATVSIALLQCNAFKFHRGSAMIVLMGKSRGGGAQLLSRCVEKASERCLKRMNTCSKQQCSVDTRRLETEGNCCKCDWR